MPMWISLYNEGAHVLLPGVRGESDELLHNVRTTLALKQFENVIVVPYNAKQFVAIARAKDKWIEVKVNDNHIEGIHELSPGKIIQFHYLNAVVMSTCKLEDQDMARVAEIIRRHINQKVLIATDKKKYIVIADKVAYYQVFNTKYKVTSYGIHKVGKFGNAMVFITNGLALVYDGNKIVETHIIDENDLETIEI